MGASHRDKLDSSLRGGSKMNNAIILIATKLKPIYENFISRLHQPAQRQRASPMVLMRAAKHAISIRNNSKGKRTLFELLDIQTAAFNAERASILNMFEERRAVYGVLSTLGVFIEAVKGEHNAMIAEEVKLKKCNPKRRHHDAVVETEIDITRIRTNE